MKWPKISRGIAIIAGVIAIISTLGGGIYQLHRMNAYASDVQSVEQKLVKGLDAWVKQQESKQCQQWLSEITYLEQREASGDLTAGQRDRLIFIRNLYRNQCIEARNDE